MVRWSVVAVAVGLVFSGCSAPDRSAVAWSDLTVSSDRHTLTVTTYYGPFCQKIADGVDVDVRDDEIIVSAWLRDDSARSDECTAECGQVTQRVTLAEPLPDDRPLRPPANHVLGCGA